MMALGLLVAGCGGGSRGEESVTTSTSTPPSVVEQVVTSSTSSIQPSAEQDAILAAYKGYWDTWLAANDPPNPDHPDLERYATGSAYSRAVEATRKHRDLGQRFRLPEGARYSHNPIDVLVDGDRAEVRDCSVDDGLIVDSSTGAVLNDAVNTRLIKAELVREGDQWKLHDAAVISEWEGVSGCVDW
jgi:hypothetical protein